MAYFRKRSGAWEATINKKGFSRTSRTFDTKAEAEPWAAVIMAWVIFISRHESEKTTLSEALDRYEKEISSSKKLQQGTKTNQPMETASSGHPIPCLHPGCRSCPIPG